MRKVCSQSRNFNGMEMSTKNHDDECHTVKLKILCKTPTLNIVICFRENDESPTILIVLEISLPTLGGVEIRGYRLSRKQTETTARLLIYVNF